MAPPRKRPDQRQDNRPARSLVVVDGGETGDLEPRTPRKEWRKATKDGWLAFWASDVANVVGEAHMAALYRLFDMRDMQTRAFEQYRRQPYVDGSKGQPVENPAFASAMRLETAIAALEDRLGLTPKAMANLGIAVGQAALTAADLNRMAGAEGAPDADADDVLEVEGWEAVD